MRTRPVNNRLRQDSPGALASSPAGDRDCYIAGPFVPGLQETFHLPSRTGLPPVLRLPHQSEDRRDAGPALPAWFKIPSRDASIVDVFRSLLLGHLMLLSIVGQTLAVGTDKPLVNDALVFEEAGGQLVVEAEAFFAQTNTEKRAWYITTEVLRPDVGRDIDPPHFADAAGGAHIEVLPDTGNDPVGPVAGESISDQAGAMAVVSYHVHFNNPGRYYIWVRALGTDGDDNTLHFGMDGEWPTNSARMHHGGGGQWGWACRHRQHKGKLWLDVPGAGPRVIQLSMREDGCEVDRFILTTNETFTAPDGIGPTVRLRSGVLPDFSSARPSVAPAPGGIRVEAESAFADGWELATARPGFSGTGYLRWTASGQGRKPGEGVLTYSFRITEPGQYRWLQFAWKALDAKTTGITLRIGNAAFCAGRPTDIMSAVPRKVADSPPAAWTTVRVDLWELARSNQTIDSLCLAATGGPAAFDQVLLGRTEADLPAMTK